MSPGIGFEQGWPPAAGRGAGIALLLHTAGSPIRIDALDGETLLDALARAGAPMLSVCGGCASCGTCRVRLGGARSAALPPPADTERNLLDCLPDFCIGERLACQIRLNGGLDGLEVYVVQADSIDLPCAGGEAAGAMRKE